MLALIIGLAMLGGGLVALFHAITGGRADAAMQAGAALLPALLGLAFAAAGRRMVWPDRDAEAPPGGSPRGRGVAVALAFAVVLVVGAGVWFRAANDDLIELAKRREADLATLRPALLKYRDDKGAFPKSLDDLVPTYVRAIPDSLRDSAGAESLRRVSYQSDGRGARVVYRGHRGPDSRLSYDVVTGKVTADP